MAKTSIFRHFIFFTFLSILFESLSSDPTSSFFYNGFSKVSNFHSNLALFGDAKLLNGTSSLIQLTANSSAGRVMYKKPIKLVQGKPKKLVSFSTYFSFSISPQNGNGLAFVMVPKGISLQVFDDSSFGLPFEGNNNESKVFAVEFDTQMDIKYGDLNENHIGIDIGSLVSVRVNTLSSINLVLNSGKILHCWIEYEANSKVLEIRLSEFGYRRPIDPLLSYPVDFSILWKDEGEVFVGLTSSNGNSNQTCDLLSWSFKLRHVVSWMHSEPLDPKTYVEKSEPLRVVEKRSVCVLRVISALVFGTGCGALGAWVALVIWNRYGKKRILVPEKLAAVHPVDYDYKKIQVVSDKTIKDGKIQVV